MEKNIDLLIEKLKINFTENINFEKPEFRELFNKPINEIVSLDEYEVIKLHKKWKESKKCYTLDQTRSNKFDYPFRNNESYLSVIKNGISWNDPFHPVNYFNGQEGLYGVTSVVLNERKQIVKQLSSGQINLASVTILPEPIKLKGRVVSLCSEWGHKVYYHWFFDSICRLQLVKDAGIDLKDIDYFIVHNCLYDYCQQTFELLNIPRDKIIIANNTKIIQADELIVPSHTHDSGCSVEHWACKFMRENFLNNNDDGNHGDKIYISRENASWRKVINEKEVLEFLSNYGFVKVNLENFLISEQARCFNKAKVVVSPHGSGLTNLVYCDPGAKIYEIFSSNNIHHVPHMYWKISQISDLEYYYSIQQDGLSVHDSFKIDMNKLKKTLELILSNQIA